MKIKVTKKTIIRSIIMGILLLLAGCSGKLNGSNILSIDDVRDHDITTLRVSFLDHIDPSKSATIVLTSWNEEERSRIDDFKEILSKSKGTIIEDGERFNPMSDGSHFIEAIFDNENKLEFYYSEDRDWIVWSNSTEDEDGDTLIDYRFLKPKSPLKEWFSPIVPSSSLDNP